MAALRVVGVPCVVLAFAAAPARFYGCPFASSATSARSQSSQKLFLAALAACTCVRWVFEPIFPVLLVSLCS